MVQPITDEEMALVVAMSHAMLHSHGMAYSFVRAYLDQGQFEKEYASADNTFRFTRRLIAWQLVLLLCTWAYAYHTITQPCDQYDAMINGAEASIHRTDCEASAWFLDTEVWMLSGVVTLMLPNLLDCCVSRLIAKKWTRTYSCYFTACKPIRDKLPALNWHRRAWKLTSVVNTIVVFGLLVLLLAIVSRSVVVVTSGYVVGNAMLVVAEIVLGPDSSAVALTQRYLLDWTDRDASQSFFLRLASLTSSSLAVSNADLNALQQACSSGRLGPLLRDAQRMEIPFYPPRTRDADMKPIDENFMSLELVYLHHRKVDVSLAAAARRRSVAAAAQCSSLER